MKIAIIGSGISGLGAAYLLAPQHDVTIYEKNDYVGGHSRTIDIQAGALKTPVDTGFIVFNDWNYPHLTGLFKVLNVPYEKSDMSFGVCIDKGWLEYSSSAMFAQKRNLLRPAFWGMLFDVLRFNKQALRHVARHKDITLGQCLDDLNMGQWFRRYYLTAMGAAIWSCSVETIMEFPARTYLQFFKNHGLLNIIKRPQWYTVTGGSREYIKRLRTTLQSDVRTSCGAVNITQDHDLFTVTDAMDNKETFDQVIFACHTDEALALLPDATDAEKQVLGDFGYQDNRIIVHSDKDFMPVNKKCWASWVYLSEKREDHKNVVSLSYWMNNLQNLKTDTPVIITLNPEKRPKEETIMDEHSFTHPVFDMAAINAQDKIGDIQGKRGLWFCGAYQRYGFHEDGLWSAVNIAKALGADIPWE